MAGTLAIRRRTRLARLGDEKLTVGLAALAIGTGGAVAVGELARRIRRRAVEEGAAPVPSPGEALHVAAQATQDTVRVAIEGYESASRRETVLFNLLSGFAGAFAFARISTSGIRNGWWPLGDVSVGGRHIHHFVPGMLIAFASGAGALLIDDLDREARMALPFGIGLGLTFDEAALLLDLRDVYWTREGLLSVQLSLGLASILGGTIVALRMLRRGEQRGEQQGLIPDAGGEMAAMAPAAS